MPGVPPDAVDNLKRAFKNIFKRGKKKSKGNQQAQVPSSPAANTFSSASAPNAPATAASSAQPNVDKPLPPTHPLATGTHNQPQKAIPQKQATNPGPIAASALGAQKSTNEKLDLSPTSATADAQSGRVSSLEDEKPALSEDSTLSKGSAPIAPVPSGAGAATKNAAHSTTTAQKLDPAAEISKTEPHQPNGTANTHEPALQNGSVAATNGTPTAQEHKTQDAEEKILAVEEPPPIATVKAAPGMSATSGPLEDFPEGGDAFH